MRKMIAAIAVLCMALLFAPVLWGLPPPGEQVPAELAWGLAAAMNSSEDANVAKMMNIEELTLEAVATETLATMPPHGGVRLVTLKSALESASHPGIMHPRGGPRGSPWAPAGCARR